MATKEAAEKACVDKHPNIDGRQANVDLAFLGAKPKPPRRKKNFPAALTNPRPLFCSRYGFIMSLKIGFSFCSADQGRNRRSWLPVQAEWTREVSRRTHDQLNTHFNQVALH